MQEFYIRKGSDLPVLRMELYMDGRMDYHRSMINNDALQDCEVTFTMKDTETGLLKISKAPAEIVEAETEGCEEQYILQYKWNDATHGHKHDTNKEGVYEGIFEVNFLGNLIQDGVEYPKGTMLVPIQERLLIYVY